jgi:hypothetical protein
VFILVAFFSVFLVREEEKEFSGFEKAIWKRVTVTPSVVLQKNLNDRARDESRSNL